MISTSQITASLLNPTVKICGDIDRVNAAAVMVMVMMNEIVHMDLRYPESQLELFENLHSVAANVNILLEFPEVPCKKIWARDILART